LAKSVIEVDPTTYFYLPGGSIKLLVRLQIATACFWVRSSNVPFPKRGQRPPSNTTFDKIPQVCLQNDI